MRRIFHDIRLVAILVIFVLMMIVPVVVFALVWTSQEDLQAGLIAGLIAFAVMLVLAVALALTVRRMGWFTASLPLIMGALYSLLPDLVIGPVDDTVTLSGGALLSFILWARKNPAFPKWVLLPVLGMVGYTMIGGILPGPLDEILVYLVTGGATLAGLRGSGEGQAETRSPQDFIEGEFIDPDERR